MRVATAVAVMACVLFIGVWSAPSTAQTPNQPAQFITVNTTTIKPASEVEYEDYIKKLNAARDKTPGAQLVFANVINLGGPVFTYIFVTPFAKWADRERFPDNAQMLSKVYGQAEANRLLQVRRNAIVSQEIEVFSLLPTAGTNLRVFDPPAPFINVIITEVHPEMNAAYQVYLNKLKIAQERARFPFTVERRTSINGAAFTYGSATFYSKQSDRDITVPANPDILRQAFGEAEGNQLVDIGVRAIKSRRTLFLQYRPDLSRPKAASSN